MKRAVIIKELSLNKIKDRNVLYKVLEYCLKKNKFTLLDLEKDLNMPPSSTKIIGKYIYNNDLANRKRQINRWFQYYPNLNKIINIGFFF